jgi:hypothetical protein
MRKLETLRRTSFKLVIATTIATLSLSGCSLSAGSSSTDETQDVLVANSLLPTIQEDSQSGQTICTLLGTFYDFLTANTSTGTYSIDREITLQEADDVLNVLNSAEIDSGLNTSILSKYFKDAKSAPDIKHISQLTDHMIFFECDRAYQVESDGNQEYEEGESNSSVIYTALRNGCRNLPTYLDVQFVGAGPNSPSGNGSQAYLVNEVFQLILFDLGARWEVSAWPITDESNRQTANEWDCGAGGLGAVLAIYNVDK